jgi:acyl-[acyl-carrier-protein] desaturase
MSRRLREALYREHMQALETSERRRSWSVFRDVDWALAAACPRDRELALCAETFCGVEMYLPDYLSQGVDLWRDQYGQMLFAANWGAEEARHSIALREYLLRTGQRTLDEMHDFEDALATRRWVMPHGSARKMVAYAALQEMTTFVNYVKHAKWAAEHGDALLARIYRLIARDEIAHCRFQERVLRLLMVEDRAGTLGDIAAVFRAFRMPAEDLLPDADRRRAVFVKAGIDRSSFVREVWHTMLKRLGVERRELAAASRPPTVP